MLKRILSFSLLLLAMGTPYASNSHGTMQLTASKHHFGRFPRNVIRTVVFPFVNSGKAPLLIMRATASCNCTTVSFTRTPVAPGQKGYVTVRYDGHTFSPGHFRKTVDITTNGQPDLVRLFIEGETR